MQILLINGSPRKQGCVFTALCEVAASLEQQGIGTKVFHIGAKAMQGCIACMKCRQGLGRCVFKDEVYEELLELVQAVDGLIVGSPVYYAGPNGSLCALLDRLFFSASAHLAGKPGAAVVSCRRGGASAAFDRLNKYFTINNMPLATSQYWNAVHGLEPCDVLKDLEGLQIMRTLGQNMAWLLKSIHEGVQPKPEREPMVATNFIS